MANAKMGAPTKLTPDVQKAILAYIRAGAYVETAAAAAGIDKTTFYDWLKRGAAQRKGIYRDFSNAVEKAQAEAEIRDIARIDKAASDGVWQAAAWRLERKHSERWGRKDVVKHTGNDGDGVIKIAYVPKSQRAG